MTLRGHSNELSLADLIQVTAQARRTCHIRITALTATTEGFLEGDLFFEHGEPMFASFGNLLGATAVHAAVNEDNIVYRVDATARAPNRNLASGWEEVLLEAARLRDEGKVPVARQASEPATAATAVVAAAAAPLDLTPLPASVDTSAPSVAAPAHKSTRSRIWVYAATAIALVVLGLGVLFAAATRHREPGPVLAQNVAEDATGDAAVDGATLTGANDRGPALLSGTPPGSPDPTLGLRPTVVCRLLVDVNGAVQSPSVYRPRTELAAFEAVALDAVRDYRFRPAQRNGKPIAAWVNWPVSFK